jgi:hypothetical protein
MDINSLSNDIKKDTSINGSLYDLFTITFLYDTRIILSDYTVTSYDEMRIDLVLSNMYNFDFVNLDSYLGDIDVILFINNIDNPLNIKEGMILKYPSTHSDIDKFRYVLPSDMNNTSVTQQLATPNLPNKTTRVDKTRQNYIENDYSLSPVILDTPREPVRITNGKFSIGGL